MSIFEKQSSSKVSIDDTSPLKAVIINSETNNGHTEYIIRVCRGYSGDNVWHVHRRYNDFFTLNKELSVAGANLPLPPKKMIGNMDREFILQRLDGLQVYLDFVLNNPVLSNHRAVKKFLDPHNYNSLKDLGVAQVSLKLRGDIDLKVVKKLPIIGRRLRKEHYLVQSVSTKDEFVLTWTPYGPDKHLDKARITVLMKSLCGMQHAIIEPPTKVGVYVDGAWVLRPAKKGGTLLDKICDAKNPLTTPSLKKYSDYESRKQIETSEIVHIVSQTLQALTFLHHKGLAYGHLHLGNILYDDGTVRLLDVENQVLGLPSYYREKIVKSRRITSLFDVDVFCIGLIIYELIYGIEFNFCDAKEFSSSPSILKPVLEILLVEDGNKNSLPEVSHLLALEPFRNSMAIPPPYFRMTSTSRQDLALNAKKTFERIKEDNGKFRLHTRTAKLHEMLNEDGGKLILLYDTKKCSSKSSSGDSDHPRSEVSDAGTTSRTPTPALSDGTTVSEDTSAGVTNADAGRSALLGAICNFNKKSLKKVTS